MSFKAIILKLLNDLGIRPPDYMENMNDDDQNKNRLIWNLKNGILVFDVLDNKVNYMYSVENEEIRIFTLENLDEITVIALKYLTNELLIS